MANSTFQRNGSYGNCVRGNMFLAGNCDLWQSYRISPEPIQFIANKPSSDGVVIWLAKMTGATIKRNFHEKSIVPKYSVNQNQFLVIHCTSCAHRKINFTANFKQTNRQKTNEKIPESKIKINNNTESRRSTRTRPRCRSLIEMQTETELKSHNFSTTRPYVTHSHTNDSRKLCCFYSAFVSAARDSEETAKTKNAQSKS